MFRFNLARNSSRTPLTHNICRLQRILKIYKGDNAMATQNFQQPPKIEK